MDEAQAHDMPEPSDRSSPILGLTVTIGLCPGWRPTRTQLNETRLFQSNAGRRMMPAAHWMSPLDLTMTYKLVRGLPLAADDAL